MFFYSVSFQRKEPYVGDFLTISASVDLYLETYEPISTTFVMMIDPIIVHSLMAMYMTLAFIEDDMFMRKTEFLQSFCHEVFN